MTSTRGITVIRTALGKEDYVFNGFREMGYGTLIPYRDKNIFLRCLRELWFRLHLPKRELWYNPAIRKIEDPKILVKDPLMTADFLKWLRSVHPDKHIVLSYDNRVARASVKPDQVPDEVAEKSTFDPEDAKQWGIAYSGEKFMSFLCRYVREKEKKSAPDYDVIYLGRDKGRGESILALEKELRALGLKTNIHICADRRYLWWKKRFYRPVMSYEAYIGLLYNTRAFLNIVEPGVANISQRDFEAVLHSVKCITNNPAIKDFALYDSSRYFVLGEEPLDRIPEFLEIPFRQVPEEELEGYMIR